MPDEFRELWERIKYKTRYAVEINTPALVESVVGDLNRTPIPPPRVEVTKARVEATAADVFAAVQMSGAKTVASLAGRFPLPNLLDKMAELIGHVNPPVRLTRRTLLDIVIGVADQQAVLDNPEDFAVKAAGLIRQKLEEQLVHGIRYEKDGTWYEMGLWDAEIKTTSDRLIDATKSLYERFVYDSEPERRFAVKLERRDDVRFYVKLPAWFKVPTPVGTYNPDWAIVMDDVDQYGERGDRLYLVRETKGSVTMADLYPSEAQKIACGRRHFEDALGVDFDVVTTADKLP